jgi:hypothetical protein
VLPDGLDGRIAKNRFCAVVKSANGPIWSAGDDRVLGVFHDCGEKRLCFFRDPALGHIMLDGDVPGDLSVLVPNRCDTHLLVIKGPILPLVDYVALPDVAG